MYETYHQCYTINKYHMTDTINKYCVSNTINKYHSHKSKLIVIGTV